MANHRDRPGAGVEKELSTALDLVRDEADHPGIKGTKVEGLRLPVLIARTGRG